MTQSSDRTRREFLKTAAGGAVLAAGSLHIPFALAESAKIKVGLMLPYTGTFAQLGVAITNGFKLAVQENGGRIAGREIEYATVDDESQPAKAVDNAKRLVDREKVDVLVGTVHSGVQAGMVKVARESGVLHIIPNAGLDEASTVMCAPNVFRSSFANSQTSYPMGKVLAERGVKTAVTLTWKYSAGEQSVGGFAESFTKGGGKVVKQLWLPFPNVEFQPILTEIAALKPDAVYVFFAGGGAAKFLKDYQASGLKGKIPLYGSGFLTDGILEAVGDAAEGVETTLHYGDSIETPRNKSFRASYAKAFSKEPDVYAVQGYDAGLLLIAGLNAARGDISKKKDIINAMEKVEIDSPRGKWRMSSAHNPVQDMYLRKVVGKENKVTGVAIKALDWPPADRCKMG
ncbi:MAG: ABC transporter substrate-binding protein [Betaproteobacteria bacterium]|nr:ABC transporter substrate-binding protein [Betaproteobacteria bacterium]